MKRLVILLCTITLACYPSIAQIDHVSAAAEAMQKLVEAQMAESEAKHLALSAISASDIKGAQTTNWLENIRFQLDKMGIRNDIHAAQQIANNVELLASSQSLSSVMDALYGTASSISDLFKSTNQLTEIYSKYNEYANTIQSLSQELRYMYDSNIISLNEYYDAMIMLLDSGIATLSIIDRIKNFILNPSIKLSQNERKEEAQKSEDELEFETLYLSAIKNNLYKEKSDIAKANGTHISQGILLGVRAKPTADPVVNTVLTPEDQSIIIREESSTVRSTTQAISDLDNKAINIAIIIIGLLGAIFIVLNTLRKIKGDAIDMKQHTDAVLKAILGLFIGITLLFLFKQLFI